MLIWMCALRCEAKPVIDYFRLQKHSSAPGFHLYSRDHIACVVSGIGALRMAAATAWAAALFRGTPALCWFNLGIAGNRSLPIGSLVAASHIISLEHPTEFTLACDRLKPGLVRRLISHDTPQTDYPSDDMVDMEGHAFITTATRFSDIQWCQSVKVISDNERNPAHRDKQAVSDLIANHIELLDELSDTLHRAALRR